jgi:hypothetical protein
MAGTTQSSKNSGVLQNGKATYMSQMMPSAELLQGVEAGIEQALLALAERERVYPVAVEPESLPITGIPGDGKRRETHSRNRQDLLERSKEVVSAADAELLQVEEHLREWSNHARVLESQLKTSQRR